MVSDIGGFFLIDFILQLSSWVSSFFILSNLFLVQLISMGLYLRLFLNFISVDLSSTVFVLKFWLFDLCFFDIQLYVVITFLFLLNLLFQFMVNIQVDPTLDTSSSTLPPRMDITSPFYLHPSESPGSTLFFEHYLFKAK